MSVAHETYIAEVAESKRPFVALLTPVEERPYSASVLRWACTEVAPVTLSYVDRLEQTQRVYDNSGGRNHNAAEIIEYLSSIIWYNVHYATTHDATMATFAPKLSPDIEKGMPGTYDIPTPLT